MAHHQGNCFCEVSSIEQVPEGMRYVMNKHIDIDKVNLSFDALSLNYILKSRASFFYFL